jgi:hypothetical protein
MAEYPDMKDSVKKFREKKAVKTGALKLVKQEVAKTEEVKVPEVLKPVIVRKYKGNENFKKHNKVAILGTVPHKLQAPFDNPEFEIWAIAHACLGDPLKRVDRIFEVHKWDEVVKWGSLDAFKKHPDIPIYVNPAHVDEIDRAVAFPFDDLEKKFQIFEHRPECYFTNSISEMMALAIDEGFEEIHVYGVNMSHFTEWGFQKPSCEYFFGLAKGMGIKVYAPTESDLCKSFYIYGKDEEKQTDMLKKLDDRMQFLQGMHNQYKYQNETARDLVNQTIGAIKEWEKQDQNANEVKEKIKELTGIFNKHRSDLEQSRDAVQQHVGAMEDVKYIQGLMKQ